MKWKPKYLAFCLLMTVLAFAACKKEDVLDDSNTTPVLETSITFICKDSVGLPDILVGIAPQSSDRDAGIFLRSGSTDNLGKIKFSNLDPQKFYYSASRVVNGTVTKRTGSVTVNQDEKKTVNVNF